MKRILVATLLLGACGDGGPAEPPAESVVVATTSIEPASSSSLVVPSSTPSTTLGPSEIDTEWFDQTVMTDTIGLGAIDVQAAVVRDGRVVHQMQFSAPGSPARVTSKSRFRIASISKILTAVTVMQLVEVGVITLDDRPLAEVAGRLGITLGDSRLTDVTVLQLLSHTSGLASVRDLYFDSPQLDADSVLAAALSASLASEPGEQFTYSNTNYVILGRLVGWRTGTTWEGAARQMVLDPLGLADWQVGRTSSNDEGDAQYAAEPGRNYMELLEAAGAWTLGGCTRSGRTLPLADHESHDVATFVGGSPGGGLDVRARRPDLRGRCVGPLGHVGEHPRHGSVVPRWNGGRRSGER